MSLKEKLDQLEKLAKAATPGPWEVKHDYDDFLEDATGKWEGANILARSGTPICKDYGTDYGDYRGGVASTSSDADYIAAASPDVVLDLIHKLRVATEALEFYDNVHNRNDAVDFNTIGNPAREALKELEK